MPDDNRTAISTSSQQPASASVDGVSATQHNLKDQIEADRYLSANVAMGKSHRGLRFTRLLPPDGKGEHS